MKKLLFTTLIILGVGYLLTSTPQDIPSGGIGEEIAYDKVTTATGDSYRVHKTEAKVFLERSIDNTQQLGVSRAGTWTTTQKDIAKERRTNMRSTATETFVVEEVADGVKIDLILNSKPATSTFAFTLENWEQYTFHKQNAFPIDYPESKNCTETACDTDGDGEVDSWAGEDKVNGYAVYFKHVPNTLGMVQAYYIDRIKIIDANNNEAWGDMRFDDGTLYVYAPDVFLNTATYPVRVDPTFGQTSCGAFSSTRTANDFQALTVGNAPENGTVDSIHYCADGGGSSINWKGVLYNTADGEAHTIVTNGIAPAGTLPASAGGTFASTNYVSKPSIVSGSSYEIASVSDSTTTYYYNNVANAGWFGTACGTYTTPTDCTSDTDTSRQLSFYITYTAGGGASTNGGTIMLMGQ